MLAADIAGKSGEGNQKSVARGNFQLEQEYS
jgi:hypothetical protein